MPDATATLDRLRFVLPDFTRLTWVSDHAEAVWRPRLDRITAAWAEVEWLAVAAGARPCAVTMATPDEFLTVAPRWADRELFALPVEIQGLSRQPYTATAVPTELGQPFVFRFVVGRPADVRRFKRAWDAADQDAIGDLLGYPRCCTEFFRRVWVDDGMVDTTWPMAAATAPGGGDGSATIELRGPAQANILWRWAGVRAVPHLPCRFDCPATVALADALVDVGRQEGFATEMGWLLEVLGWPAEWSALHGIAEVRTPIVKVVTRTDATARTYTVRRHADTYPREGATGLRFPCRAPGSLRLSESRGFRRGLENPIAPVWLATDNGFPSVDAMRDAHRPIVALAAELLGPDGGRVVDLGCGNGALLRAVLATRPATAIFGMDLEPARVEHARQLNPGPDADFRVGDIFDEAAWWPSERFALALLMPGRLVETTPQRRAALLELLGTRCDRVLVYAYGDWLARHGSLAGLAAEAGIDVVGSEPGATAAVGAVAVHR
ncbi:MAG: class I SAM-dependent methyltransferase [Acidimicrobiales bacterium]